MLASLFGKRSQVRRDRDKIWTTETCKFEGLLSDIAALDPQTSRVLLITHFPRTFRELDMLLRSRALPYERYPTPFEGNRLRTRAEYQAPGRILLAPADVLPGFALEPSGPAEPCHFEIYLIVAEHHPLPASDDALLQFAGELPCRCRLGFYESLDGALLEHFGATQLRQLLTTLRLPDMDCLSNPTIDKAIRAAQEKIARRVIANLQADSAEQWFEQNLT